VPHLRGSEILIKLLPSERTMSRFAQKEQDSRVARMPTSQNRDMGHPNSGDGDAVVFRLTEDREQIRHLQQIAKLFAEMKQLELASCLSGG
jgi:hypothetical protein